MDTIPQISIEYQSPQQVFERGKQLEGMTFREVLALGIYPPGGAGHEYDNPNYKGGLGTLVEERFFGYRANSDREPDFAEAGVELKATCYDIVTRRRKKVKSAGERLVLTMIPYDEEAPESIYDSHLWHKCKSILLVWYHRNRDIPAYDRTIEHVFLFTPPPDDMRVIERDYALIMGLVRDGRAEYLSESLTTYLGACTKGANAEKGTREQKLYAPGHSARSRAFSFKRSYMDYVLHHYIMGEPAPESLGIDPRSIDRKSLAQYAKKLVGKYVGKTDVELCHMLDIEYTGDKAQRTKIANKLLGIRGGRAAEFEKCGISVRTVCPEYGWKSLKESFPIMDIDFLSLAEEEDWYESELRDRLADLSYLLVVFEKTGAGENDPTVLRGCMLWSIPTRDLDGQVLLCWESAKYRVRKGIEITPKQKSDGSIEYRNNLPKIRENPVAHVRPGATKAAYRFEDGTEVGNVARDAEPLPDGRYMTRQRFWLNSSYMLGIITRLKPSG